MSTTTTHDVHQSEEPEASERHPLGLDTDSIFQDLVSGWSYIIKGGWIFLVLLAIISFIIIRNVIHVLGITLTGIFMEWVKIFLS